MTLRRPARGRTAAALAMLCTALMATACTSDDGGHDDAASAPARAQQPPPASSTEIRTAYATFISALYDGEFSKACDKLAAPVRRDLSSGRGCPANLPQLFGGKPLSGPRPRIHRLDVDATKAHAQASPPGEEPQRVNFTRERGEWKIAAPSTRR